MTTPRTRSKKIIEVADMACTPCSKEADLGKLSARIENNEASLKDVRHAINDANDHHETDRKEFEHHFSEFSTELIKLNSSVKNLTTCIDNLTNEQKLINKQLTDLMLSHQNMTNMQATIDTRITQAQRISDERYTKIKDRMEQSGERIDEINARVTKLEQHKQTIFGICAFIVSLATFAGLIAQIYSSFHK